MYLARDPPPEKVVVLLTILASAASVLTGLFLRLVLCCVLGVDADVEDSGDDAGTSPAGAPIQQDGTELSVVNPAFGDDGI